MGWTEALTWDLKTIHIGNKDTVTGVYGAQEPYVFCGKTIGDMIYWVRTDTIEKLEKEHGKLVWCEKCVEEMEKE